MTALGFPTAGQQGWFWNGTTWCPSGGAFVNIVAFAVTGPYMPSPGLMGCIVECIGGGGGGGGATATGGSTTIGWICGGGGGSSGQYARKALAASLVAGGVMVTIGAGGAGGGPALGGGPGGTTTFGALCIALGGLGGDGSAFVGQSTPANLWGNGGARNGAAGAIGDAVSTGNAGSGGTAVYWDPAIAGGLISGGLGGEGMFGGNVKQARAVGGSISSGPPVGTDGPGQWGCGGSGGATGIPGTPGQVWGVAGASGLVMVTEFIAAGGGAPPGLPPCPCPPFPYGY